MKKCVLSLVLILWHIPAVAHFTQSAPLARIERSQVVALESKIALDLAQDTFKKRAVLTVALIAGGYLTYKYLNSPTAKIPAAPASSEQILANNKFLQENNELLRKHVPGGEQEGSWWLDTTLGKVGSWFWEFGKWSTQQAIIGYMANVMLLGSSSALGKAVKTIDNAVDSISFNFFHERDLKWFLISRARVTNLFNELESHAFSIETGTVSSMLDVQEQEHLTEKPANQNSILPSAPLDAMSYVYHKQTFEQTWQQLSERLAALVAFIEYKAHRTERASVRERLLLGAQHILQLTNATAHQCEQLLTYACLDTLPTNLLLEIRRLRSSVSEELMLANKLEHEVSW
ncbi:MAG: hypothetical protein AB7F19_06955 [Candidatus Babeliales bacterium]